MVKICTLIAFSITQLLTDDIGSDRTNFSAEKIISDAFSYSENV